ncbi:DUF2070 family protein [Halopenitus persicus]|uniref:Putative membrane protein n=1 Tax=Halopenitus persicus TaxID=1048396 RepID=A0A1H3ISZ2_9EURY|nr:DUF2070 family protein [Halopenitus persicus]QHS17262.1 DUF2070 family protein [haloarchaeon 3A1-DGR]SDY30893.1 putative membrane protein [Halopenitus persicus]
MGADNVDVFQRMVFSLPPLKVQIPALVALSLVYSFGMHLAFTVFTPIRLSIPLVLVAGSLVFLVPFLLAGELFHQVLPRYPRSWSYFLALFNQFVLFVYGLVLSGADTTGNAWSIVWLAFITVHVNNVLVLLISTGIEYYKRILAVSSAQTAVLVAVFYLFVGGALGIETYRHVFSLASVGIAAVFLVLILLAVEYLIKSNTDVSAFTLTSGLLRNDRESLDLGFEAEPDVQTLAIDNGDRLTLAAPWIHPGPLGGFGGGQLSGTVIEALNAEGTGFFLHVPCTHKEDLADPEDAEKVLEAVADPERTGRASTLVHRDYGEIEFFGRRFDGKRIVFLHAEHIDDYDTGVFMRDREESDVLLVDLHKHDIQEGPEKEVQYGTAEADRLKRYFDDFLGTLDDAPLHDYDAGFDVHLGDRDLLAMVEVVDGERTLLMGIDTNGVTADIRDLEAEYREEFDHVLLFSTDTHASIHDLANMTRSNVDAMRRAVAAATDDVAPATIGLTSRTTRPLQLLKNDYNGLVFSVNILIRLTIISLFLFYFVLIVWMF